MFLFFHQGCPSTHDDSLSNAISFQVTFMSLSPTQVRLGRVEEQLQLQPEAHRIEQQPVAGHCRKRKALLGYETIRLPNFIVGDRQRKTNPISSHSGHLRQLSLDRLRSLSSPSGANCPGAVNAAVEDDGDEGLTDGGGGGDGGSPALAMAMGAAWRRAAPPDKAGCKS